MQSVRHMGQKLHTPYTIYIHTRILAYLGSVASTRAEITAPPRLPEKRALIAGSLPPRKLFSSLRVRPRARARVHIYTIHTYIYTILLRLTKKGEPVYMYIYIRGRFHLRLND